MSYVMHTKRLRCIDAVKRFMVERKHATRDEVKREIMCKFGFSGTTANRYIEELILMQFIRPNDNTLHLVEEGKEKKGK